MGLFDSIRNLFGGDDADATGNKPDAVEFDAAEDAPGEAADEGGVEDEPAAGSSATDTPDDELRDEFRPHAEDFAAAWPDHDFDFSTNSLVRLDAFVDDRFRDDRFSDAVFNGDDDRSTEFTGIVVQTGSYFGETLVRSLDAEWVDDEDFGAAVRIYGEDEDAVVNVFHIAAECLRESATFEDTYERATAEQ